jgi:predicted membrane protein
VEFDRQKFREQMRQQIHQSQGQGGEGIFSARFAMGLVIIALGALFLFDSFGWIESRYVLRKVWPLIFVVIGVSILSRPGRGRRKRNEGWVFIVVGLWIFISKIGLFDFSFWGILFPSILLFVGGMLVYKSLRPPRVEVTFDPADAPKSGGIGSGDIGSGDIGSAGTGGTGGTGFSSTTPGREFSASRPLSDEDHAEFIRSFAVLSGSELRPMSRPFRGADLTALLGGIKLDLTSARMEGDSARIDVIAFCGGIEIYVPPDWTVTSKVATLLGGFTDKRRPTTTLPTKTLILDGFAVMGGIEVKN